MPSAVLRTLLCGSVGAFGGWYVRLRRPSIRLRGSSCSTGPGRNDHYYREPSPGLHSPAGGVRVLCLRTRLLGRIWLGRIRACRVLVALKTRTTPVSLCVSVPALGWAISSRVCRRQRRPRLPAPARFTKSSMMVSAFWRAATRPACGSLPATEAILRTAFRSLRWRSNRCRSGHA